MERIIRENRIAKVKMKLSFEPRDLWLGLHWNTKILYEPARKMMFDDVSDVWYQNSVNVLEFYICLLPCFPVMIRIRREKE